MVCIVMMLFVTPAVAEVSLSNVLVLGNTAIDVEYLFADASAAQDRINSLIGQQGLGLEQIYYRLSGQTGFTNIGNGSTVSESSIIGNIVSYVDPQGASQTVAEQAAATVTVETAAMGFKKITVSDVTGLTGATQFKVAGLTKAIGQGLTVNVMTDTTTLSILNANGVELANAAINVASSSVDTHVSLTTVAAAQIKADVEVVVGSMGFKKITVSNVTGISGATQFKVAGIGITAAIGQQLTVNVSTDTTTVALLNDDNVELATATINAASDSATSINFTAK